MRQSQLDIMIINIPLKEQNQTKPILKSNSGNTIKIIPRSSQQNIQFFNVNPSGFKFVKKPISNEIVSDLNISNNNKIKQSNKQNRTSIKIQTKILSIKPQKSKIVEQIQNQQPDTSIQIFKKPQSIKKIAKPASIFKPKPNNQKDSCIKKLTQLVPSGKTLISTINRQRTCLSLQLKLMIKDQQMFKFQKSQGFIQSRYQITSQENKKIHNVGFIKCNLLGSIFNIYRYDHNKQSRLIGTINYYQEFRLKTGPRNIQIYLIKDHNNQTLHTDFQQNTQYNLKEIYEREQNQNIIKFINIQPQLNQNNQYVLDFKENQKILPSIKNIILAQYETHKQALKLYKIQNDKFKLKVKDNMSPFIAYCFVVSSLLFKWVCQ